MIIKNKMVFLFSVYSLRSVVDKPPIGGKELLPLTGHSLSGFRLNPGPVSVLCSTFFLKKGGSFYYRNKGVWLIHMRVLGENVEP